MKSKDQLEVKINPDWCKGCGNCVSFCPTNVLAIDHHGKSTMVNREGCILCGMCEKLCPDFAIWIGGKEDE
ncbi:MAG: hypothetical protein AVO33_10735 [delta proteobacterium ML8_F1]|nr:MAG: hypothetical protein AVO33_10735 [delta proteobacterium ML8_F1]